MAPHACHCKSGMRFVCFSKCRVCFALGPHVASARSCGANGNGQVLGSPGHCHSPPTQRRRQAELVFFLKGMPTQQQERCRATDAVQVVAGGGVVGFSVKRVSCLDSQHMKERGECYAEMW